MIRFDDLIATYAETMTLKESEYPLTERVLNGPNEDDIKMFIMEKSRVYDINEQVRIISIISIICLNCISKCSVQW